MLLPSRFFHLRRRTWSTVRYSRIRKIVDTRFFIEAIRYSIRTIRLDILLVKIKMRTLFFTKQI